MAAWKGFDGAEGRRVRAGEIAARLQDAEDLLEHLDIGLDGGLVMHRVAEHRVVAVVGLAGVAGVLLDQPDLHAEALGVAEADLEQGGRHVAADQFGLGEHLMDGAQRVHAAAADLHDLGVSRLRQLADR